MSLYLELKTCASTDSPKMVISEAIGVSERIRIPVHVDINGVLVMAYPGDNPVELHRVWKEILDSDAPRSLRFAAIRS